MMERSHTMIIHKKYRLHHTEKWFGWLFIAPMVIGYLLFLFVPIVGAFIMSFTDYSLLHAASFVGLDNYKKVISNDPLFWKTVGQTLYFSMGLIPLNLSLALGLALLLNRKLPGIG